MVCLSDFAGVVKERNRDPLSPDSQMEQKSHKCPQLDTQKPISFQFPQKAELVRLSSVAQPCLTLCDCSTPGLPIHHQLPKLAQTHIY